MFAATAFLTACSQDEVQESKVTKYEVKQEANYSGSEFITVAKGDTMELQLQPSSGVIRWYNTETGEYVTNRKTKEDGFSDTTALSDVVVGYYTGSDNSKYTSYSAMDTYTYGIEQEDGLIYEEMENGVRFIYHLASSDITYMHFPGIISDERMQELVIQHLDEAQLRSLKTQYRQLGSGNWSRDSSKDTPLSGLAATRLYEIFYEVGKYSYEELEKDNTEWNRLDEMPSVQDINFIIEYTLEGDDMVVNVPTENLVVNEDYPVRTVQVLPYLMSSNEEEGYLFVPDGSGSLIYLDNIKLKENMFNSKYYGGDILQNMQSYVSANPQMMLPVYGMKSGDFAVLGVIEEGAQVARLDSYIKNYFSGIDYARSTLSFFINEAQTLFEYSGSITRYSMVKAPTDSYTGDIRLRYSFLTGEDADYTGMAKRYQELLVEDGTLTEKAEVTEKAPLFLNMLGELDKEKYFLGIPYDSSIALTSFEQAGDILTDLAAASINNVIVKYDGIMNGGMNQRAVESVKLSSRLGGSSAWKALLKTAEETGAKIFPGVDLQTAYTTKNLSKEERAYTLIGSVATIYTFDPVDKVAEEDEKYKQYVIAPTYMEKYAEKFAKSYDKLGVDNLASGDFMTFISGDYRNEAHVSQTTAIPMYANTLTKLADSYNLMLSNPRVDAYSYVDYLTDIPAGNSTMKILDAAVPFTQMVLEGYVTFGSDFVNKDSASLEATVMKAMENKSALNFRLIDTATSLLSDTTLDNVFFSEYDTWKDDIITSYNTYNEFYQKVKDAEVVDHQVINQNDDLRMVEYSNGLKIYFNYGEESEQYDGVKIPAGSYVIVQ